jgi:hypothetical protein
MENFSYQMLKGNAIVFSFVDTKILLLTALKIIDCYTGGRWNQLQEVVVQVGYSSGKERKDRRQ